MLVVFSSTAQDGEIELANALVVLGLTAEDGEIEVRISVGKRNSSDLAVEEVEVLSTMEDELEKQLDAKASKSNLSVANVKNILKHVITNEHVLAMVRHTIKGNVINNEDLPFQPKLTRAKTKELMKAQPELSWPVTAVTPIKKPLKCHVLMDQELPEDSSDEEYNPNDEDQLANALVVLSSTAEDGEIEVQISSDDEKENESMASDLDSQPRTPATITLPPTPIINDISTQTSWTDDGLFKMPQENIGQRTRSKFSLSDTPLETIEQAFIPPDITTDMYDLECDDEDWNNFLKDFTKPLTPEEVNDTVEDDEDADPEYNILADEEEVVDHEELRMDRAVKVSKKELNALFNELFEYTEMRSSDDEEPRNMTEPTEQIFLLEPELLDLPKETIEVPPPPPPAVETQQQLDPEFVRLTEQQRLILDQQMRKHVQLTTQHFLQTYAHPHFSHFAPKCKEFLGYKRGSEAQYKESNQWAPLSLSYSFLISPPSGVPRGLRNLVEINLKFLADNKDNSAFRASNLAGAIELVESWEERLSDGSEEAEEIKR
uniref:Uncharacterized protein n=1 Tax=Timema cristinae TaxID=61476 RepID=A0A7R9DBQ1_TIMCR|nr:unnamed protein product [Timema cristinae]